MNDDRADWREAWALFPGEVAYVWHGALHATTSPRAWRPAASRSGVQIIWAKERLVLCRGDYHWQHEPCFYAVRSGGKGHWNGDRKQTTLWQIPSRDQDAATVHGTQKPVECMRRPMLNNSSPGQAVYEPFSGSGTSIIAAETCGRISLSMELDPAYVDVAVTRWQSFTGEAAILDGDGRSFAEIAAERTPRARCERGMTEEASDAMGRKPIELTDEQRGEIETLGALLNQDQIADYLGICRTTFHAIMERDPDIAERYKRGKAKAIAHVAKGLLQKARSGDTVSSIFFLKTQAGWRETDRLEHAGGLTINVVDRSDDPA